MAGILGENQGTKEFYDLAGRTPTLESWGPLGTPNGRGCWGVLVAGVAHHKGAISCMEAKYGNKPRRYPYAIVYVYVSPEVSSSFTFDPGPVRQDLLGI